MDLESANVTFSDVREKNHRHGLHCWVALGSENERNEVNEIVFTKEKETTRDYQSIN